MTFLHQSSDAFEWEPPASAEAIRQAEAGHGAPLPEAYVALLKAANGGTTQGSLSILSVEECVQRNIDYEVAEYMPGYFMIGDDGGRIRNSSQSSRPARVRSRHGRAGRERS